MAEISPRAVVTSIMVIFILAVLGAALSGPLNTQITNWKANLTSEGNTGAATVVGLIPLLYWILLGVGVILYAVGLFLGHSRETGL